MKKKIGELTLNEIIDICNAHVNIKDECQSTCPFFSDSPCCYLACELTSLDDYAEEELAKEIEVEE